MGAQPWEIRPFGAVCCLLDSFCPEKRSERTRVYERNSPNLDSFNAFNSHEVLTPRALSLYPAGWILILRVQRQQRGVSLSTKESAVYLIRLNEAYLQSYLFPIEYQRDLFAGLIRGIFPRGFNACVQLFINRGLLLIGSRVTSHIQSKEKTLRRQRSRVVLLFTKSSVLLEAFDILSQS